MDCTMASRDIAWMSIVTVNMNYFSNSFQEKKQAIGFARRKTSGPHESPNTLVYDSLSLPQPTLFEFDSP